MGFVTLLGRTMILGNKKAAKRKETATNTIIFISATAAL